MRLDRYVIHGVVLLVAALISGFTFSDHLAPRAGALEAAAAGPITVGGDDWNGRDSSIIRPTYIPTAPLPDRAPMIYTVAAGDTLESIAKDLKIPFREITWSNPGLRLPLKTGQVLRIPPVNVAGFVVVVRRGDTLAGLGLAHGVDPLTIADFNRIRGPLTPGTMLVVPVDPMVGPNLSSGLVADPIAPAKFVCPLPGSPIIQKFGPTGFVLEPSHNGYLHFHTGVDILAAYGAPIFAAAGGTVTAVGFEGAFGLRVEITDSYGLVEIYAHMQSVEAAVGEPVQQGKEIGLVGSTGLSIGSHLHLQLEIGGEPTDPLPLIGCNTP
ncbi:MAG TPA: peptidoglycan DD-metalloendopeptidase family protein [Candidatus Dormibacteraeota bacterium]|nr:peptidoglycan DD-metalloendopeptidase family protein [Candidatus Dormibacteraeota bacterium]